MFVRYILVLQNNWKQTEQIATGSSQIESPRHRNVPFNFKRSRNSILCELKRCGWNHVTLPTRLLAGWRKHGWDAESTIVSEGFKGGTRGAPIIPRDAVSRTANVERNGGHKWVKEIVKTLDCESSSLSLRTGWGEEIFALVSLHWRLFQDT